MIYWFDSFMAIFGFKRPEVWEAERKEHDVTFPAPHAFPADMKPLGEVKSKYTPTEEHRVNRLKALRENALADKNNMRATAYIRQLSKEGISIREIARRMNADGFVTRHGKEFTAVQVTLLAERAGIELPGRKLRTPSGYRFKEPRKRSNVRSKKAGKRSQSAEGSANVRSKLLTLSELRKDSGKCHAIYQMVDAFTDEQIAKEIGATVRAVREYRLLAGWRRRNYKRTPL